MSYRAFMAERALGREDFERETHPDDPRILGDDRFLASLPATTYRPRSPLTLAQLAANICAAYAIDLELVRSRSSRRQLTPVRLDILQQATEQRVAILTEVAHFLGRDLSALSKLRDRHDHKRQ